METLVWIGESHVCVVRGLMHVTNYKANSTRRCGGISLIYCVQLQQHSSKRTLISRSQLIAYQYRSRRPRGSPVIVHSLPAPTALARVVFSPLFVCFFSDKAAFFSLRTGLIHSETRSLGRDWSRPAKKKRCKQFRSVCFEVARNNVVVNRPEQHVRKH